MYNLLASLTAAAILASSSCVLARVPEKAEPAKPAAAQSERLPQAKKEEPLPAPPLPASTSSQRQVFIALLMSLWHGGK
jgi:hypothetical protein